MELGVRALPFRNVTNYEMCTLHYSDRESLIDKFENNDFIKYFRTHRTDIPELTSPASKKQYYTIDEFNLAFKDEKNDLKVCHHNIRRICKNKGNFLAFLSTLDQNFDIIALTEVGDNAKHFLNKNFLSGYTVVEPDLPTNNKYGGSAILVKNEIIDVTFRDDLKIKFGCDCTRCAVENTWIEVNLDGYKYIISSIYRHGNGKIAHFVSALENTLNKLDPKDIVILSGDFNINLLNIHHKDTSDYYTTLAAHNFLPYIISPTRITDTTATCIDHIFIKVPMKQKTLDIMPGNIISHITDHLPNFVMLKRSDSKHDVRNRPLIRIFSERNVEAFKQSLNNTNWEQLLHDDDVNTATNTFYNHTFQIYNQHFPLVRLSRKKAKDKKWFTEGLRKSTKHKSSLYKKQLTHPTPENISKFKVYRNKLDELLKKAEENYYKELFTDQSNGVKNFWKSFGETLNCKKVKGQTKLSKLIIDDNEIYGDEKIANSMNNHFCTIGRKIHDKIPGVPGHFQNYMNNKINESFYLRPLNEADVFIELSKLKENKSAGPDEIRPKLAKKCKEQFSIPLAILYNKSIEKAVYPSSFKLAKVIALFKKHSRFLPSNYRPISLLNCFDKVFEKLIHKQMIAFIDKHKILYVKQYGFRQGFSTTLALIDVVDNIKWAIDNGEYAIGIFLDVEKAFDSINHSILLHKLAHYGFRGHVNSFLKSYLENRKQYTRVNNKDSNQADISFGVPQGSVLGPLLFILYVNDMKNAMTLCDGKLFADDTSLLLHNKDINILVNNAEQTLREIYLWFKLNKLSLSIAKSSFVLFHGKGKDKQNNLTNLKVENESIPRSKHVKYIGLILDEQLNWSQHIKELCASLTRYFSIFYNIRKHINKSLARTIYYTCIHSRIKYGIEIYGTANKTHIKKLQVMQNKLMKLLLNKEPTYSTDKLHKELRILKVSDIHRKFTLQFIYKCLSGDIITNFVNYFTRRENMHIHDTSYRHKIQKPKIKTEMGRSTTQFTAAKLWNLLPEDIKRCSRDYRFKQRNFTSMLSKYND